MADKFCFEPAGVFVDFSEGLKPTGLRLKVVENMEEIINRESNDENVKRRITSHEISPLRIAHQQGSDTTENTDYIELGINLGRYFKRILLLNGTEDHLVRPTDVERTYEAILRNIETAVNEAEGRYLPIGGSPMMYTVGLEVISIKLAIPLKDVILHYIIYVLFHLGFRLAE
jgi:hypothetical protein